MAVLIAVLVGAAVAFLAPHLVLWMRPGLQPAFALTMLAVVAANRDRLSTLGPQLALAMLGLNLGAYGLAFLAGTALGWPPVQRRTLVIEVGMQNAGLGSVLALAHLGEAGAVPSAFYTALCVVTAACALPFGVRLNAPAAGRSMFFADDPD